MDCPHCAADIPEDDLFCESCGKLVHAATASAEPGCDCGAQPLEIDSEGFCLRCGKRVRRPAADHIELEVSFDFAGASDRGLRHDRNEDRVGIAAAGAGFAMVVCDGVSASRRSEVASAAVVEAVLEQLTAALTAGSIADPEATLRQAIGTAAGRLRARSATPADENPPSTTCVAALVRAGHATLAWVGDSRAYWIDAAGAKALTVDHSWMNAVVSSGEMTARAAAESPQAHAIIRWLGADADGPNSLPETVQLLIPGPGMILLCTDGLWNYATTDSVLAEVVQDAGAEAGTSALALSNRLIDYANSRGGQDNTTAVVLRFGARDENA